MQGNRAEGAEPRGPGGRGLSEGGRCKATKQKGTMLGDRAEGAEPRGPGGRGLSEGGRCKGTKWKEPIQRN